MKRILILFSFVMAATLILTSLVFMNYPHNRGNSRDSLLYIDGEPVYNLSVLSDEQYNDKVGSFTRDGKTYFAQIVNDFTVKESGSGSFNSITFSTTKFSEDEKNTTNYHFWITEDLDTFVKSDDSWTILASTASSNYRTNGYFIVVFYEHLDEVYPGHPEYASVEEIALSGLGDIIITASDPVSPEGPGAE